LLGAKSTDPQHRNKRNFGQWDSLWVSNYSSSPPDVKVPYCEEQMFSKETLESQLNSFVLKYPVVGKLRGFMDVCEESWNRLSIEADLAPGHANESLIAPIQSEELPTFSFDELNRNKHVSIGGYVMDVDICSYIYDPITGDFPGALGHDISVAIIKDEFTEQWLDQPVTLCLDSNQQSKLESLVRKFRETYPTVGKLSDASKYQTLREQEVTSIPNQLIHVPSSLDNETKAPIQLVENNDHSQTGVIKQDENENKNENENEHENENENGSDNDNDNEWDLVQHSDVLSPTANKEIRKDGKIDNNVTQGEHKD